jgi:hypothetical protein
MYLYVRGIDFTNFYDFGIVLTVWYILIFILLAYFRIGPFQFRMSDRLKDFF